jgi:hypothetical protein
MPNKVYYLGSTKPGIHFIHGLTEQLFYNYPNLWHHVVCHIIYTLAYGERDFSTSPAIS